MYLCTSLEFIDELATYPDVLDQLIDREEEGDYQFSHNITDVTHSFIIHSNSKGNSHHG